MSGSAQPPSGVEEVPDIKVQDEVASMVSAGASEGREMYELPVDEHDDRVVVREEQLPKVRRGSEVNKRLTYGTIRTYDSGVFIRLGASPEPPKPPEPAKKQGRRKDPRFAEKDRNSRGSLFKYVPRQRMSSLVSQNDSTEYDKQIEAVADDMLKPRRVIRTFRPSERVLTPLKVAKRETEVALENQILKGVPRNYVKKTLANTKEPYTVPFSQQHKSVQALFCFVWLYISSLSLCCAQCLM